MYRVEINGEAITKPLKSLEKAMWRAQRTKRNNPQATVTITQQGSTIETV
jgi:hypothetical protein